MTSEGEPSEDVAAYERVANVLNALGSHIRDNPPPQPPEYIDGLLDGIQAAIRVAKGIANGVRRRKS
jgi:hypothetical protein